MAGCTNKHLILVLAAVLALPGFDVRADFDEATKAYLLGQYEKARYEALIAATDGNPKAQMLLGQLYFNGEGVPKDIPHALHWYNKAAENGFTDAQYRMGILYHDGKQGIERNLDIAYKWLKKALENGEENAREKLDWLFKTEQGNVVNLNENVEVLKQVAASGNQQARFLLSQKMIKGSGIPQDKAGAVKMIREDAEVGFVKAQKQLGELFFYGEGLEKDYIEAYAWSMAYAGTKELGGIAREGKQIARSALRKLPAEVHAKAYVKSKEYFENYVLPFHKNAREVGPEKYRIVVRSGVKKDEARLTAKQESTQSKNTTKTQSVIKAETGGVIDPGILKPNVSINAGSSRVDENNSTTKTNTDQQPNAEQGRADSKEALSQKQKPAPNESAAKESAIKQSATKDEGKIATSSELYTETKPNTERPVIDSTPTTDQTNKPVDANRAGSLMVTGESNPGETISTQDIAVKSTVIDTAKVGDSEENGKGLIDEVSPQLPLSPPDSVSDDETKSTDAPTISNGPVASREDMEIISSKPLLVEEAVTPNRVALPEREFEEVYNVLVRKKSGLYRIYAREYELDKKLEGRVVLEINILPNGRISAVEVISNTLESPTLEQAFVDYLKANVSFRPAEVAEFKITYPVDFLPP